MSVVSRENRPPEDILKNAEPVSSRFRLSCREEGSSDLRSVFVSARTFRVKVSENRLRTLSIAVRAAETIDDAFAVSEIGFFAFSVNAAISFFGSVMFSPISEPDQGKRRERFERNAPPFLALFANLPSPGLGVSQLTIIGGRDGSNLKMRLFLQWSRTVSGLLQLHIQTDDAVHGS